MKKGFQKTMSLLLAVLMVVTMLPVTAIAEEIENLGCTHHPFHTEECGYADAVEETPCVHICAEDCAEGCAHEHDAECGYVPAVPASECNFRCEICEAEVIYSDEVFYFTAENNILAEDSGMNEIVLHRDNTAKKTFVTVLIYDNSTNYGKDYVFSVNSEIVAAAEGSISLYDAFAAGGENTSAVALDLLAASGQVSEDETAEDMKASDMLKELDALGIRAAEIPVAFEEGQTDIVLSIEVIDDEESEYEENFMLAVLDEKGEAVGTAQAVIAISDNEEPPEVKVSFDCEAELALDEDGKATLSFKREGNLATNTLAMLFHDGNPLGYVDFAPYQTEQTVEAVYTGVYMLGDENGNITDMTEVIVTDPLETTYTVPEGADPELDAVPDYYATIPDTIMASSPTWFPDWARYTDFVETETQLIYMMDSSSSDSSKKDFYQQESNNSKGGTSWYTGYTNAVGVNTSGTWSGFITGTNKVKSKNSYSLLGIGTVETKGKLEGIDSNDEAKIGLEVDGCTGWHKSGITSNGEFTMTATVPIGKQDSAYIHVYNRDDTSVGGGANFYIPNGVVMNKRAYYFQIRDDLSANLSYYGDKSAHPTIDKNSDLLSVYPSYERHAYNYVDIVYTADTSYPARYVGFKFYNASNGKKSDIINVSIGNGFYFDFDFISKYEKDYIWQGDVDGDGTGDAVFSIIPVYEKIPVYYEIKAAKGGTIEVTNPNTDLYMGDYAVFKNSSSSELKLVGIEWKAYNKGLSSDILASGTKDADADGLVRLKLNNQYTHYEFKGIYSADANELGVYYAEENPKGKIDGGEGIKVSAENYVKNEFVTLAAKADSGFVTKWTVDTDVYYGDVLYYQLTGNPDYNKITVSFVSETEAGVKTANVRGIINSSYVNLMNSESVASYFAGVEIGVTAGKSYSATSGANGSYTISNFKGVPGGRYTVMFTYAGGFAYGSFVFDNSSSYNMNIPQFAPGDSYPLGVSASLAGSASMQDSIPLETGKYVDIRVTVQGHGDSSKPTKVILYFHDTISHGGDLLEKTIETMTESVGDVSYWDISIPTEDIPVNTRLYVEIESEKVIVIHDANENVTGTEIYTAKSGKADGGYKFTKENEDTSIPIHYDVPNTPSITDANEVFNEAIGIPILGNANFSLSSTSGGFFVTRTDPSTGYIYLMCGYSFEGLYAKGNIVDKYDAAKKSNEEAQKNTIKGKKKGSSEPAVETATGTNVGGDSSGGKKPSNWTFAPAFMFKITAKPGETDTDNYYISGYETILGFDTWYFKNFPYNFYGVPVYISVSFGLEAVLEMAINFKNDRIALADANFINVNNAIGYYLHGEESDVASIEGIIGAPKLTIGAKGGVGINNFLSVFLAANVRIPVLFQLEPQFDIAGQVGFDISAGADLVIFTGSINLSPIDVYYGDNGEDDDNNDGVIDEGDSNLIENLKTIQGQVNTVASSASARSLEDFDFNEALNSMTFSLMSRSGGASIRSISDPSVVESETFKNTGIHLWRLENGKLIAAFLKDNGDEGLNYLSAVYATSDDGGKTWSEEKFFSDNTSFGGSSLQYDINIFELEDRILLTWSEADFDRLISEMELDPENLTAAHVAKLMGAMNLCGVFLDKYDGSIIGEAFTIAENSTVACGVLDAVQNGENVYVYYQRNAIPENEELTFEELASIERTIALARKNVNDEEGWISTPVRAEDENGHQYRIVGVEPFSYNGIVGEIIVVDRNGKLVVPNADGSYENSVDDRMMFLRTYEFDAETGEPKPSAILPITGTQTNSQNPQVVSDDENIYLFFNQDGNVAYIKNFVVNENDGERAVSGAYAVRNSDGSYTFNLPSEAGVNHIASHGSINYGTDFTVSMDNSGNILICWVADEQKEEVLLATEEIYGIMLRDITNGEVFEIIGASEVLTEEEAAERQLWAVGKPVAITDENGLFGALDSICTDGVSGEFLLGYTKLNNTVRTAVTAAEVKVVSGTGEPDVAIEMIDFEQYPMAGSKLPVKVTVANKGFEPIYGVDIEFAADANYKKESFDDTIWPGTEEIFTVELNVPENFSESKVIDVAVSGKGNQSSYSDSADMEVLYGTYFAVDEVWQTSIPGTKDVRVKVTVTNKGNAAGIPEFYVYNSIFGTEDDMKTYEFTGTEEVSVGETAVVEYVLEDTYINDEQTAQISVHTGEGDDRFLQRFMPKPAIKVETEATGTEKPDYTHEHDWSEWVTLNGVRSRECASCGMVIREYIAGTGKTDDEANPETGAPVIVFEKGVFRYAESEKALEKKRRR